jgi:Domain of unknown function (DUF5615)
MARLYADEDFDYPVVAELRRLGHDVLTALEAGHANQRIPDEEVLAFAVSQGRAAITFNRRHFFRLHRSASSHAGIIICKWHPDMAGVAVRVHEALAKCPVLDNHLIRVNRPQQS